MIRKQNDRMFIDIKQDKTDKDVSIPLLPIVKDILKKAPETAIFHKPISDQRYNDYIKDVCRMAQNKRKDRGQSCNRYRNLGTRKEAGIYPKWQLDYFTRWKAFFCYKLLRQITTSYIKDINRAWNRSNAIKVHW